MNGKRNLVLLVVFAGMLLYAVKGELPKDEAKLTEGVRLAEIPRKSFETVRVKNAKGEFTFVNPNPEVTKDDSELGFDTANWKLEGIKDSRIDPAGLSRIVSNLKELRFTDPIPPAELESDLSVYGLANPGVIVEVKGKDTKGEPRSFGVEVGGLNKYVSKRYARILGEPSIYLIADAIYGAADKARDSYRLKNPVSFLDSDLTGFEFKRPGQTIKAVRDNNRWRITEPIKATGGNFAIPDLLKGFRGLSVRSFVDDPAEVAKLGLDGANYSLKVDLGSKPAVVVRLGERKTKESQIEGVFQIEGEASAYIATSGVPKELSMELDKLREKRLFTFEWERAEKILVEMPKERVEISKVGEKWMLGDKEADTVFVKEFLRQWGTLEASSFPEANAKVAAFGFDKPSIKLSVRLEKATEDQVFIVGKSFSMSAKTKGAARGVKYYAARGDLSEPFIVDKESVDRLFPKPEALLKSTPAAGEAAAKE